jgi:hypothetical protein
MRLAFVFKDGSFYKVLDTPTISDVSSCPIQHHERRTEEASSSSSSSTTTTTGFYNPLAGFSLLILEVSR